MENNTSKIEGRITLQNYMVYLLIQGLKQVPKQLSRQVQFLLRG